MILCSICSTIYLNLIEEFWTLENLIAIWYADFDEPRFSGHHLVKSRNDRRAGFFKLTLPMLVSLAGAVITYTVILVQTSESVKKSRLNL
ncbi:hypothetical protein MRX96_037531 [Rhipicephalus microplus]